MLTTLLISGTAAAAQPSRFVAPPPPPAPRTAPRVEDRRTFEQGLRGSSGGRVFAAIERYFPEDSVILTDRLYTLYTGSRGSLTASLQQAMNEMDRYTRSKAHHIANAPTANLVELNRRVLAVLRVLRERNVDACSRMAGGEGVMTPRDAVALNFHEMLELSVGMIETAGIGSRAPETPGRGQANEDQIVAWVLEMERLDPNGELRALMGDEARMRAATPAQKCSFGILVHESIAAMEPEAGAGLFAFLMAEGLRQGAAEQR